MNNFPLTESIVKGAYTGLRQDPIMYGYVPGMLSLVVIANAFFNPYLAPHTFKALPHATPFFAGISVAWLTQDFIQSRFICSRNTTDSLKSTQRSQLYRQLKSTTLITSICILAFFDLKPAKDLFIGKAMAGGIYSIVLYTLAEQVQAYKNMATRF